jgi:RNA polymerase primary sigma factor
VRQRINGAIDDHSRLLALSKVDYARGHLEQELERPPTTEEVAERVDMDPVEVETLLEIPRDYQSLDAPVQQAEEVGILEDFVADDSIEDVDERLSQEQDIEIAFRALTDREATILRKRFELDSEREHTLAEVGRLFGVTRERVRQVEAKALESIKAAAQGPADGGVPPRRRHNGWPRRCPACFRE